MSPSSAVLRLSLEVSLPAPRRRPRNVARKCIAKKLKVTETTSQDVNSSN
jgi:hypothetical protein